MRCRVGLVLALSSVVFLIACGDSGSTTTVKTLGPGEAGTPRPRPTLAVSSGRPEVDNVIIAALARDDIALAGLTGYSKIACRDTDDVGDAPACRDDESSGDEVEVLAAAGCDTGWVRPETVPDAFRLALAPHDPKLLAVYVPAYPEGTFGDGFGANAVAVFDTGAAPGAQPKGAALHIKDGRVVWIETGCVDAAALLDPAKIGSFIIEPPPAAAP